MAQVSRTNVESTNRSFTALSDGTLNVGGGEFFCLLAPSGCRKTTLLRILAELEEMTAGGLTLDGADFSRIPCLKRNAGMVFQSLALFPHLSVGENSAYGPDVCGVDKT